MSDGWEPARAEARDASKRRFAFGDAGLPGCMMITVSIPLMAMPVGTVWYRWVGNATIETMHSFVIPELRRCGLRTALHERLIQCYPTVRVVMTAQGSDDGGDAWLKATGFKRDSVTGDWKLSVNRRRRRGK